MTDHTDLLDRAHYWLEHLEPHEAGDDIDADLITDLAAALAETAAEHDRFREHSVILNSVAWRIAAALGDIPEGATKHESDGVLHDLTRLIAQRPAVAADRTDSPVPCPHVVTGDEGTSYCSLAEGTPLFEGTALDLLHDILDDDEGERLTWAAGRRVRVVAVDHQETTDHA